MALISGYIALIALLVLAYWLKKHFPERSTKYSILELRLGEESNVQEKSEKLFQLLSEVKIPFILELLVHSLGEEVRFFISTKKKHRKKLEETIYTALPEVEIYRAIYQEILSDFRHEIRALSLEQEKGAILPLKYSKTSDFSPFWALLRTFSSVKTANESIALQLVVQLADKLKTQEISKAIASLSQDNLEDAKHILDKDTLVTKDSAKILEGKVSSPLFEVNGKIIFTSNSPENVEILEERLKRDLAQSASGGPAYNSIEGKRVVATRKAIDAFYKKEPMKKKAMLLNTKELTELFYFTSAKSEGNPKLSGK